MAAGDRDRLLVEVRRAFGALAPDEAEERVAQVEGLTRPAGTVGGTMVVGTGDPLPRLSVLVRELEWEIGPRGYWTLEGEARVTGAVGSARGAIEGPANRIVVRHRPGTPSDADVLTFLAAHRERVAELKDSPRAERSRSLLIARIVDLGWAQDDWGAKRILDRLSASALAGLHQPIARERMLAEIADGLIRAQPARGDELAMTLIRACAPRVVSRRGPYAARGVADPALVLPEALLMVSNLDPERRWIGTRAGDLFRVRVEPRPP